MSRFVLLALLGFFASADAKWRMLGNAPEKTQMRCGKCFESFAADGGCDLLIAGEEQSAIALLPDSSCTREGCHKAVINICFPNGNVPGKVEDELEAGPQDIMACKTCFVDFKKNKGCEKFADPEITEAEIAALIPSPTCMRDECESEAKSRCFSDGDAPSNLASEMQAVAVAATPCHVCFGTFKADGGCDMLLNGKESDAEDLLPDIACTREECRPVVMSECDFGGDGKKPDDLSGELQQMQGDMHACDSCFTTFKGDGGCDMLKNGKDMDAMKLLPSESCTRSECLPLVQTACEMPDFGNENGMQKMFSKFSVGYKVTMNLDMADNKDIGFSGSFTFSDDDKYADFSFLFDTGVKEFQDLIKDAEAFDFPGCDGDETLSLKARISGGDEAGKFSMELKITDGDWPIPGLSSFWPNPSNTICLAEDIDQAMKDGEKALTKAPGGMGLHGAIPDPGAMLKDVSAMVGAAQENADGIAGGAAASIQTSGTRGGIAAPVVPVNVGALVGGGERAVDENLNADDDFGMRTPHGGEPPFTMKMGMDPATGLPNELKFKITEQPFTGTVTVAISDLTLGDNVNMPEHPEEPVCSGGKTFDEFAGEFQTPDDSEEKTRLRRLGHGQVQGKKPLRRLEHGQAKLFALESMSKVFKTVRHVYPKTRSVLPRDATLLWNRDELHAAKIERVVKKKYHVGFGGPLPAAVVHPMMLAGSGLLVALVAFAAGLAFSKKRNNNQVQANDENLLLAE